MSAPSKPERQRLLVAVLEQHEVHSQAEARSLLAGRGIETTQATVSRDLDEIGAIRVRGSNGSLVYRLGAEPEPAVARARLPAVLHQFVTRIASSGNLAVVQTPPAGAGPVAKAIDEAGVDGVLATLAGDDTVLVVAEEGASGAGIAAHLRELAGGERGVA